MKGHIRTRAPQQSDRSVGAHYGEIWYDLGGKRTVGRSATTDGVLDAIYELAGVQPPQESEIGHRGHPLAAEPTGAAAVFYVIWPLAVFGLPSHEQRDSSVEFIGGVPRRESASRIGASNLAASPALSEARVIYFRIGFADAINLSL